MIEVLSTSPLLSVRSVSKRFAGVLALRDVKMDVYPGSVHAVFGANGAGKSTLVGVCSGEVVPDTGTVMFGEHQIARNKWNPTSFAKHGVSVVHQEPALAPRLSVVDNIALPTMDRKWFHIFRSQSVRTTVQRGLEQLGIELDLDATVESLPVSARQIIEIAKAFTLQPKILFLDEPNSALSVVETNLLFQGIRGLQKHGTAVVVVSHRIGEVLSIADQVTVMSNGQVVFNGESLGLDEAGIVRLIGGERSEDGFQDYAEQRKRDRRSQVSRISAQHTAVPVISCEDLTRRGEFEGVSLKVYPGEVVGLAGLVGSGRSELAHCLLGLTKPDSGLIRVDGKQCVWKDPRDAMKQGFMIVPEDRKTQSLFQEMSIDWNAGVLSASLNRKSGEATAEVIEKLRVKHAGLSTNVSTLSGGNQQKVVIARCLLAAPRFIVLDEPTRGVDVAAKKDIRNIVSHLVDDGLAVLVISSETDEIVDMADRIVVLSKGFVVKQFDSPTSEEEVLLAQFEEKTIAC